MNAEDAISEWGRRQLIAKHGEELVQRVERVEVDIELDGGCPTCGTWPVIAIVGHCPGGHRDSLYAERSSYDFGDVVAEVLAIVGGA